jgi:hypothetical protein
MHDSRTAHHIVIHIDACHAVFLRRKIGQQMADIGAVELARLRCHAAR